ncbi:hypothetical protein AGR1C_Lc10139 [Agrobacterium fabacearum TT111]|nr:hypothetical protein AGR1C_Lc10139 [Agrobacterium fabacearum TT111]
MLQQVTVVAGKLDNETGFAKREALDDHVAVSLCVSDPTVRERGEIRVLRENILGRHIFLKLDEEAFVANECVERIKRLDVVGCVSCDEAFAGRRHSKIDEGMHQWRAAKTAKPDVMRRAQSCRKNCLIIHLTPPDFIALSSSEFQKILLLTGKNTMDRGG